MKSVKHEVKSLKVFLEEREQWRQSVAREADSSVIVCDPGDDIVCEFCNGDAVHDLEVNPRVVMLDGNCLCPECYGKEVDRVNSSGGRWLCSQVGFA